MSLLLLSLVLMTSGLVGMFAFPSTPASLQCKRREENKILYWNAIPYFSLPSRSLNRGSAFGYKKERQNGNGIFWPTFLEEKRGQPANLFFAFKKWKELREKMRVRKRKRERETHRERERESKRACQIFSWPPESVKGPPIPQRDM